MAIDKRAEKLKTCKK